MIAPAGSASFLMVRGPFEVDGMVHERGLYIANKQFGFHVHDDGNATFSLVSGLPVEGIDATGLATIVEPGKPLIIGLSTRVGLYRATYDFSDFDGWYADGERME